MTIICPSCAARFRDPPADVLKSRPMQCSKCEHQWSVAEQTVSSSPSAFVDHDDETTKDHACSETFVDPLVAEQSQRLRIQIDAPALQPTLSELCENEDSIKTKQPVVVQKFEKDHYALPNIAPVYVDRPSGAHKQKRRFSAFTMANLACIAVVGLSVAFQAQITRVIPQSQSLYQTIGLGAANSELNIANVVTTKSSQDGISRLIVKGEIENIAQNTVPVPPIHLIMRGQSNTKLYAWTVSAGKQSLKAGEKSSFTAIAHDYPNDAVNVEVEFAPVQ